MHLKQTTIEMNQYMLYKFAGFPRMRIYTTNICKSCTDVNKIKQSGNPKTLLIAKSRSFKQSDF